VKWAGKNIDEILDKPFEAAPTGIIRQARWNRLRARQKALEQFGPCIRCNEPADYRDGWCTVCALQEQRMQWEIIPRRIREDLRESYS
jgi:hypothetical protein